MTEERGTLKEGEVHPMAQEALNYVASLGFAKLNTYLEAYSSCAIADNRLGEVCADTLNRAMKGEGVGERYILGLAFSILRMETDNVNDK